MSQSPTQSPLPQEAEVLEAEVIRPDHWQAKAKSPEEMVADELGEEDANLALSILDEMAVTEKAVADIAAQIIGSNRDAAERMFHRWKVRSPTLCLLYTHARRSRADVMFDRTLEVVEAEPDPHKAKVLLDARKWATGRLNRLLYGDDPQVVNNNLSVTQAPDTKALIGELERRLARKAKALAKPQQPQSSED